MAVADLIPTRKNGIPSDVRKRIDRGRQGMLKDANKRRLYYRFWRGDTYAYLNEKGALLFQNTITTAAGGGKPPHRIRNTYNFIRPIVEGKVSAATQRVPSYEVIATTTEPEDAASAQMAGQVALYGYDKWRLRRVTTKVVTHALVGREGFAYPYFDSSVGPYIEDPGTGERIGQGEIKVIVLSANEVFWEPGCEFDDSRWHAITQARPIDLVQQMPGFYGKDLAADANTNEVSTDKPTENMVLVTEYFERPSAENPDGCRYVIANDRLIVPVEKYPLRDHKGQVIDEPVLHRLSYTVDPDSDRDMGLVELLIDLERTIQDCWNKLLEWKNRCLNPQMTAPVGSMRQRKDDTPGAINFYTPIGGQKPEWERPPAVPRELFEMLDMAIQQMRAIASDVDIQADPNVTARTVQAVIETNRERWQSFLGDLAEFHSRLMRHCLNLVARHYTEPRLVNIMGLFGPDLIPAFLGADLNGQTDVRVNPDSITVKSRKAVIDEVTMFADRQWITPQAAMATIRGGVAEKLGESWTFDVARCNQVIQLIKQGPEVLFNVPPRYDAETLDPQTGQPGTYVPGWMPRRHIDNTEIWIQVLATWMKTASYDRLGQPMQEAAMQVFAALRMLQQEEQAAAIRAQTEAAQQLGAANAARPQVGKPMPDQLQLPTT